MKNSDLVKVGKVFATTLGWDGKDYDGVGKIYDAYRLNESSPSYASHKDFTFVKIYSRQFKCYVAMQVMPHRCSRHSIPVLEYFSDIEK